ncbi:DNA-binding transcriptional activator of the SARP family [Micromonospora viridifaciens]|uniref:DNA-binding transcriptional activator of the SARP family n=2 Tax=Micromonospora viridifaciens TaxID=1881 RepID=A0A1C4ZR59_MICVI|nr:AfsR/SARP family transcriptional regulator [Micromonospora viridifaciens]SCF35251.1 DNA-binding transcriptional activator of the SARP family [Micromonospora viridifaciens]
MRIAILGPLAATHHGQPVVPTAVKPRTVLAVLAVNANDVVPVDVLISELWSDSPPRHARTTIQTYVLGLRKLMQSAAAAVGKADDSKQVLVTTPAGYLLRVPRDSVDAGHFERLANIGYRARERQEHAAAARAFAEALSWWRGPALVDVQAGRRLRLYAQRLSEGRLNALSCRIEADVRLGRHHELIGELSVITSQHPTHEGLVAHLMLALYRSGRRCEALEAYQRLRANLTSQRGLEPSPALRRLHRSMLSADQATTDLVEPWHGTQGAPHRSAPQQRIPADVATMPWSVSGPN